MVLTITQQQDLITQFENLTLDQQVQNMAELVNDALRPFEGNIDTGYSQGIKLYIQATKDTEKEADKLYI